jgi:hypothetical protein
MLSDRELIELLLKRTEGIAYQAEKITQFISGLEREKNDLAHKERRICCLKAPIRQEA